MCNSQIGGVCSVALSVRLDLKGRHKIMKDFVDYTKDFGLYFADGKRQSD
jgi:hypothetical protein